MPSRIAAPTMAMSQVDMAKNPLRVHVEQVDGRPAAAERPDDADGAGQDQILRPSAGHQHGGEQARPEAENDPRDNAHDGLLVQLSFSAVRGGAVVGVTA
jgi:hypothetical protein